MAAVGIGAIAAESCDLGGKVDVLALAVAESRYQNHAELRAYGVRLGKEAHHLWRGGGGGNVKIGGFVTENQVAHATADQVSGMSLCAQRACDADGFTGFV